MSGLLHLRLTVPDALCEDVRQLLTRYAGVGNVTCVPGGSLKPAGDLIEADVARELASPLVEQLREMGLAQRGGIVLTQPVATPFDGAAALEQEAPGEPDDAVLWDVVVEKAEDGSTPTVTFYVFLLLATLLAAVAIITDSPVLVVGAMVVGPDFAVLASICTGMALGRRDITLRSVALLLSGFAFAIVVVAVLGWVGVQSGFIDPADVTGPRPLTQFIWRPDRWSLIVALLAGTAGVLAFATDKSSAMVGVFISVTTVPAAGGLALGLALGDSEELIGSARQLGLNLAGLFIAGLLTVLFLRASWAYVVAHSRSPLVGHAKRRLARRRTAPRR